jgi:hypothetical protein
MNQFTEREEKEIAKFKQRVSEARVDGMTVEQWLAVRKEAGLKIDPESAEVDWNYALTLDPYGILPDLPESLQQVGREYFARAPGSAVWVALGDLPETTREALWKKHSRKLAFPAGLEGLAVTKRAPMDH